MNTQIQGTARLAADPEIHFTQNGKAVCELRLAFSNSHKDKQSGKYVYSPAIWVSATLWETMASNAAESLSKGDEVLASGQLEMEAFKRKDGTDGEKLVLKFAEVAPSIRRNVARVQRGERASDSRPNGSGRSADTRAQVADDPWAR